MEAPIIRLRKGRKEQMKHRLKISVSREPPSITLVHCRQVTVRERFLRLLFGEKRRVTVIVPGDSVETVSIEELPGADSPVAPERGGAVERG